ncbi:MAG: ParB/RepB/Spo0J family partition protein [Anaerolineales bacterium]
MKDGMLEGKLLSSIAQKGMEQPLQGVEHDDGHVLLNGFKRYRCARQLQLHTVPYLSLGTDEVHGIITLLRASKNKVLHVLEEARFIDELHHVRHLSVADIATELSHSKAWVSMRLDLIARMSPTVREELFSGRFPAYAYMYTLKPFMRMNSTHEQIDLFVRALSNKKLSLREIEQLANGFFRGPDSIREEILKGNLALPLRQLHDAAQSVVTEGCTEFERVLLADLERTQKYMQRVMGKSQDPRLKSPAFHAQSHLLTTGILSMAHIFTQSLKKLHEHNQAQP